MTTLKTMILSVGAVTLLGASGLFAQTRASADIPFEFTVQNTALPAGTYTMSVTSPTHNVMSIQNQQTGQKILVIAPDAGGAYRRRGDKNVVVFHKSGDRYFLAAVKTDAVCTNVPTSKLERELSASNGRPIGTVIVAAVTVR